MTLQAILGLVGFLAACFAAAASAAVFRPGSWYARLEKPSWNPPDWVFGPVWTVLYVAIGVSGWLVWRRLGWVEGGLPLALWTVQLVLNGLWSVIFFGLRRPGLALLEMAALWAAVAATIAVFMPIRPFAAWLLVPYLAWVSFAFVLNLAIVRLNRA